MNTASNRLDEQLSKKFTGLSPKLQIAARYVLENPQEVATQSLRKVAKKSGLTPPTFSRLARAVGFKEYENLRDVCRNKIKVSTVSLADRAVALQQNGDNGLSIAKGSFADKQAISALDNINQLMQNLDVQKLSEVADHLSQAPKVRLVGALSSQAMLEYLVQMARLALPNWELLGHDRSSIPTELVNFDENTTVVVLSVSPYIARSVETTRLASKAGATVIVISDDVSAPVLKYSTHSFLLNTDSPQFFPSYVAIVTFLEILMGMIVRRSGKKANQRIRNIESLSHELGDYLE